MNALRTAALLAIVCTGIAGQSPTAAAPPSFRAMTFNIRYGSAADGDDRWELRAPLVLGRILAARPALLGLQECQPFQLAQLRPALAGYEVLGRPRGDGPQDEACYLLVERERFRVERSGTFWLGPTPHVKGSRGWDAVLPRVCTWAVVRDRSTHARLLVANTHFDHRGAEARLESARQLAAWARPFALPCVLLGDLNSTETTPALAVLRGNGLADTWRAVHPGAQEPGTFTGFTAPGRHKIDYVMASADFEVLAAAIDRTRTGTRYPSDHFPVHADLRLPAGEAPELMPVLAGEPWHIGDNPALGALGGPRQEVVDHAIWQARDGRWQLWACIRGTAVGRVLFAWEGDALEQRRWTPRGVAMRARPDCGESIDDWGGQEWIQAPHVIVHAGRYHMLYGGHRSELEHCQINLATSADGRAFERYRNGLGQSRLFVGPGEARDPMTITIDGVHHCYYTGNPDPANRRDVGGVYCRTSRDLVTWSEPVLVCWGGRAGDDMWSAECPHVVFREGYYYLFRTTDYRAPLTHVYRSRDPLDFGLDDDARYVGTIPVAAPEIVRHGGQDYISSVHDLRGGVQLQRLAWLPAADAGLADAFRARCAPVWSFEDGTLEGWTAAGAALDGQPTRVEDDRVRGQRANADGRYLVSTWADGPGDAATGRLQSPEFELPAGRVTLRLGGGLDAERLWIALHLAADDSELYRATGHRENSMRAVTWDVRAHAGERAYLLLVDESAERWGHLHLDDVRVER